MRFSLAIGLFLLLWCEHAFAADTTAYCQGIASWINHMEHDSSAVEITHWEGLTLQLRYGGTDNIVGRGLYCGENRAFVHKSTASKLQKVLALLRLEHPGYKLVIWDATRPSIVQQELWSLVRGTDKTKYVSNPRKGSLHTYGMALDLTAMRPNGLLVDMGSDFDDFSSRAWATYHAEDSLQRQGIFTERQVKNRRILRSLMQRGGFIQLSQEWWHFNAESTALVQSTYRKLGE